MSAGRIRIRIPSKKGDGDFFVHLSDVLSDIAGIRHIETNPLTGSILFIHDADTQQFLQHVRERGHFDLPSRGQRGGQTYLSQKVAETYQDLNKKITTSTEGFANIPDIAFLGLLGLGIYQISRGNFTAPAWYAAFWYALNIFLKGQARGE
jgi:hypothetical protein